MVDEPNAVDKFMRDTGITGAFRGATDAVAKKVGENTSMSENTVKGIMPWLAGGAALLTGMLLLQPIQWLVQGTFKALRNILTLGGLLEDIPIIGGLFKAIGDVVDTIGEYAGYVVPAIAAFIGYKAFQSEKESDATVAAGAPPGGSNGLGSGRISEGLGLGAGIGAAALGGRQIQHVGMQATDTAARVPASPETSLRNVLVGGAKDATPASNGTLKSLKKLLGEGNLARLSEAAGGTLTESQASAIRDYAQGEKISLRAEIRGSWWKRIFSPWGTIKDLVSGTRLGPWAEKLQDGWRPKTDIVMERAIPALQEAAGMSQHMPKIQADLANALDFATGKEPGIMGETNTDTKLAEAAKAIEADPALKQAVTAEYGKALAAGGGVASLTALSDIIKSQHERATTGSADTAPAARSAVQNLGLKAGKLVGHTTTHGLTAINAGKALYYAIKGDSEQAAHYATATGTLAGVHQVFHNQVLHKYSEKAILASAKKLGGEIASERVAKLMAKFTTGGLKVAGRTVPILGAGVSMGFSIKSASNKETTGQAAAELGAGTGEALLGTVASPIGMGFVGGEIGRESINGVLYLVGSPTGDPSLTRMLMDEGMSFTQAGTAAWIGRAIEPSHIEDQQNIKIKAFQLANGHEVAIPEMGDVSYPRTPNSVAFRMYDKELDYNHEDKLDKLDDTGKLYRMMGLAKRQKVSIFGGSKYSDIHDDLSKHFTDIETYEDSARAYLGFATRFNEESRQQIIDQIKNSPGLNGRRAEDIVPVMEDAKSWHLENPPKITAEKYPDAYEMLKRSVNEGVNVDELSPKQQHHLLREAIPVSGLELGTFEQIFGSEAKEKLKRVHEQYSEYMKKEYVPYVSKLQKYEEAIVVNQEKIDTFFDDMNLIQKREQIQALEKHLKEARDSSNIDLTELHLSSEYTQKLAKAAAADQAWQGNKDTANEMILLDARAEQYKADLDYLEEKLKAAAVAQSGDVQDKKLLGQFGSPLTPPITDKNTPGKTPGDGISAGLGG